MDNDLAPAEQNAPSSSPDYPLADLQQQLVLSNDTIKLLRAQRRDDAKRLAEVGRTRDKLESRAAAQMELVARTMAQSRELQTRLEELEQRVDSFDRDPAQGTSDQAAEAECIASRKGWQAQGFASFWFKRTLKLAKKARKSGDLVAAQTLFKAAALFHQSASLWTQLGHILREQELFKEAEAVYNRALVLDPENAENIFLAGFCAENIGRNKVAASHYKTALAKDPTLVNKYGQLRDFDQRLFS